MKKRALLLGMMLTLAVTSVGCGKKEADANITEPIYEESSEEAVVGDVVDNEEEEDLPDGKVRNELTGELIDESLANQRPIAVMVDNESIALPHYGLTQADVVYEMMNSTENGRITRFMALVKDWETLEQFGSIRSARVTNCILAAEWNAVLCHDGGPFYIDEYIALPSVDDFNGGFSRVNNGKSREYTEYIVSGDLDKKFASTGASKEYNKYYTENHFKFAKEDTDIADGTSAVTVDIPFPHNGSYLTYDESEKVYKYFEYKKEHVDPQNGNAQLSFKNVILQCTPFELHSWGDGVYDPNGYMYYKIENNKGTGNYITNGKAEEITWSKGGLTDNTKYYDASGNEIKINIGKTYIALVPDDAWGDLVVE